ncbi:MAG TPA: RHS repeat-associated core domain-containing protein, partial [Pyrinomonadaceae bacterium]|nr:RHS repeat-associated core domain-containing protein [Pyrinomonadaceae bacterium]
ASSTQSIASGDGYVETTISESNKYRMIGLSNGDSHQNYNDIDFAFYPAIGASLQVYEGGVSKGTFGSYATGDVLRVAVEGGMVKYRKNGTLLYTSTVSPTYPLLVDTSFYSNGATLNNVVINGAAGGGGGGASASIKWLVTDQLGTPRMIFDQTGSLTNVSRHDYLPFGEELFAGTGGRTTAIGYSQPDGIRQKFTGYEADAETGLNFAQARYHSAFQGRFTSPDPMLSSGQPAEPQSWNRYGYVLNNPLVYSDPTGLIWGYQDGTNANGERVRTFMWFDGDQVDEGWSAYHSNRYVGRDEVIVLASDSDDFLRIAKSNFSEEEYSSLLQAQGADCTAFNDEQRSVINREIGKEVGRGWRFAVQKGIAGIFGGLAGGAGSGLNATFGAATRQSSRLPPVLFHYTDEASAGLIQGSQLGRPGGQLFLTNNGGLTPLQAQLELSLPAQNSARALFAVDSQVLNTTNLLRSGRVTGNVFGRPGGGFEFQFRSGTTVPQGSFTPFRIGP